MQIPVLSQSAEATVGSEHLFFKCSYSAQRQTSGKVIVGRENGDLVGDGCEQDSTATDPTTNSGISDSKVLSSIL